MTCGTMNHTKQTAYQMVIVFLFFLSGCADQQRFIAEESTVDDGGHFKIEILGFSTDKDIYGFYEEVKADALIQSSQDMQDVTVRPYGIKPYSYAHIDESKSVNLDKGDNLISFTVKTPYCTSGCGGVYPGPYQLNLELTGDNLTISSEKTIILEGK